MYRYSCSQSQTLGSIYLKVDTFTELFTHSYNKHKTFVVVLCKIAIFYDLKLAAAFRQFQLFYMVLICLFLTLCLNRFVAHQFKQSNSCGMILLYMAEEKNIFLRRKRAFSNLLGSGNDPLCCSALVLLEESQGVKSTLCIRSSTILHA